MKPGFSERHRIGLAAAALALAGAACYANSFRVPFLFDDPLSTVQNPSLRSWATALSPPHGRGLTVEGRPVLNLSLAVNWHLSGSAVWSYHLLNLLIHLAAGCALAGVLRRTFERIWPAASPDDRPAALAWVIALLWTVHPLQTESVTYVVQRAESLMGLFYLLTLYAFIRYAEADGDARASFGPFGVRFRSRLWFCLSWVACLAGMATKEVMVSAPVMVLLYDRTFLAGTFAGAWRRRWKIHLALAATWIPLFFLVWRTGSRGGTSGLGSGVSPAAYCATQFPAIVRYLKLCFWPHPLVFDYGTEWVRSAAAVLPSAAVVAALAALAVAAFRRRSAAAFPAIFFFAILSVTSLVPGNRQTSAEHRLYLPLASVLTLAVAGAYRLLPGRRGPFLACVGLLSLPLGAATLRRNRDYASAETLYRDTVRKMPGNAFARYNLGDLLDQSGRSGEAVPQYLAALRLDPGMARAALNLGNAYVRLGRPAEAEAAYREALGIDPKYAAARYELGLVRLRAGRRAGAEAEFREAVRLDPGDADARDDLGGLLLDSGRLDEARGQFEAVVRMGRASVETRYDLGMVDLLQRRPAAARSEFEAALRLDPSFGPARDRLAGLGGPAAR